MLYGDEVGSSRRERQEEPEEYIFTVLSDHEIKLSECENLSKKGSCV